MVLTNVNASSFFLNLIFFRTLVNAQGIIISLPTKEEISDMKFKYSLFYLHLYTSCGI